jgi:hypothetical protein
MGVSKKFKVHMQVGTSALLGLGEIWAITLFLIMHVIKLATYWIRM